MEVFLTFERAVNDFVWGPIMLALLVGTGVFLTFRTGWVQVRWFGYIMKNTVAPCSANGTPRTTAATCPPSRR